MLGLVVFGGIANSGTLTPYATSSVFNCLGSAGTSSCNIARENIGSYAPLNVDKTFTSPAIQMTVDDDVAAGYGVLHAQASTTFDSNGGNGYTDASAQFLDVITISSVPFNGSPGSLYLSYTLDGSSSATGKADAMANIAFFVDSKPGYFLYNIYSASGQYSVPMAFSFIYGQPFSLYVALDAYTGTAPGGPGSGPVNLPVSGSGAGTAAFFNTFILSGMTLTDSSGNPVTAASFSSGSGTHYGPNGVVPEPSSACSLLCGGLALTVLKAALSRNL